MQSGVLAALVHAKQTKKATGWVRGDVVSSVEALKELNEVRKENAKYRDAIGHLEIELALPPIPSSTDPVEIVLIPTTKLSYGGNTVSGTSARLRSTWINAFPVFYSNFKYDVNDWGGEIYYRKDVDECCILMGAAYAAELAAFDTDNLFRISKDTLERLCAYYIEVGLMHAGGESPFTESAERFARRNRINGTNGVRPTLFEGTIESKYLTSSGEEIPDEIPF